PARHDAVPGLSGHDAKLLVFGDVPLALGLCHPPLPSGARVAARLGAIPYPAADVFLVLENPANSCGRPAALEDSATADALRVQFSNEGFDRFPFAEIAEDPLHCRRFAGVNHHAIAVRPRATTKV